MIRIKSIHKCKQKLKKLSALDSMKFMRTGKLQVQKKESEEEYDEESQFEVIIMKTRGTNQVVNFVEGESGKSRVIYRLKKKSGQDQKGNQKLPVFFRQIQKVSETQLQQARKQNIEQQKMQKLLLKTNKPFRQSYQ